MYVLSVSEEPRIETGAMWFNSEIILLADTN
jgi:hypothetical protein